MKSKYYLIDEIELCFIVDCLGRAKLFDTEKEAIEYAKKNLNAWQVIEIV